MNPQYRRTSGVAPFLRGLLFALLAVGDFYATTWLAGQPLHPRYQVLAGLSLVGVYGIFRRFSFVWRWKVGRSGSLGTQVLLAWLAFCIGLAFLGLVTRQTATFPRRIVLGWMVSTPLLFLVAHVFIRYVVRRYFTAMAPSRSAVIAFINPVAQRLARLFGGFDTPQFNLLGFFDDRAPERTGVSRSDALPTLGPLGELAAYVNRLGVEVVFVVLPAKGEDRALAVVEQLGDTTASVYYVPDSKIFDLTHMRVDEIGGVPVITLTETPFFGADGLLKRLMDIVLAGVLLAAAAPLFLLVAAAIRLRMGSPVFFVQRRYGLAGQQIKVYKFRTMRVAEDDATVRQASREDPRITPLGRLLRRTSIDELPQFWNVLKGDMSVVGPRPHAITHNEYYRQLVTRYMVRHKVKPGLTGWAQVQGLRGEIKTLEDMQRRVAYDLDYIYGWSPGFDLNIIWRTLWLVIRGHRAY